MALFIRQKHRQSERKDTCLGMTRKKRDPLFVMRGTDGVIGEGGRRERATGKTTDELFIVSV